MSFLVWIWIFFIHKIENHIWNHLRGQICPVSSVRGFNVEDQTFMIVRGCKLDFFKKKNVAQKSDKSQIDRKILQFAETSSSCNLICFQI